MGNHHGLGFQLDDLADQVAARRRLAAGLVRHRQAQHPDLGANRHSHRLVADPRYQYTAVAVRDGGQTEARSQVEDGYWPVAPADQAQTSAVAKGTGCKACG